MWRELRAVFERHSAHDAAAALRDRARGGRRLLRRRRHLRVPVVPLRRSAACATSTRTRSGPRWRRCWPASCRWSRRSRAPAWAPASRSRAAATSAWPAPRRSSARRSPSWAFRWRRARRRWCMAPIGDALARDMLLAASVHGAQRLLRRRLPAAACCPMPRWPPRRWRTPQRIAALAPQAARLNKRTFAVLRRGARSTARCSPRAYDYADSRRASRRHRRLPRQAHTRLLSTDHDRQPTNANLFAALRAAFPADLDAHRGRDRRRPALLLARPRARQRDDRQPARRARACEKGARIAVQVEKSVEAMMLYLATLRAGYVFLPLNTAYQQRRDRVLHRQRRAGGGGVQQRATFGWVAPIAIAAGTRHVFTLDDDRTGTLLEVRGAVQRPAHGRAAGATTTSPPSSTPAAPPAAARARCSRTATCCRNAAGAEGLLGLDARATC